LEDKSLRSKKVTWLSKHDKQCGGLYGMLLLVRGMPVYLTNHVDRSDKNLLHGRSGILLGWELAAKEPMPPRNKDHFLSYLPKCVYVQFRANAIVVGLRSAKWGFLENAAADRPEIWWWHSSCGTAPLRRSPGRGKMVCPSRISRAAVLGTNKQARHWLLCFTKGNQPLFLSPSRYP
jgi:hypothetical protein